MTGSKAYQKRHAKARQRRRLTAPGRLKRGRPGAIARRRRGDRRQQRQDTGTVVQKNLQAALPARVVSAPLRRLTSPRGVISTHFLAVGAPPISMVAKLHSTTQPLSRIRGRKTVW
jgi:hypothetical protein